MHTIALFDTRFQDWDKDYKSGEIFFEVEKEIDRRDMYHRNNGHTEVEGWIPVGNWTSCWYK